MTDETTEPTQPVYPPIDATKGIPPITPFNAWTWTTPVIPQFYWNVYSSEQRIRQICTEIGKIQAYLSYFASNSNAAHWYLDERFTETETRLTKRIDALETELHTEVEALNKLIADENTRAKAAEQALQNNIDVETSRAENQEAVLQTHIDTEASERKETDNNLHQRITEEETRANNAETLLQSNIDTETKNRKIADEELKEHLDSENERAATAEELLQKHIDTEASKRENADNELESTIRANKTSADEADKRIQDSLDTEIANRKNSDTALGERIDTETTARAQAETNLGTRLDTEASNRATADNLLTQQVNRRVKASNVTAAPDSHITVTSTVSDTAPDETTVVIADTFTPDFDKLESGLTAEITRANSAETELSGRISHETNDRENADKLLNQAVAERLKATGVIAGENINVQLDPDNTTVTISAQAGFTGVEHDNTLNGTGIKDNPLSVNTSNIATTEALNTETNNRKTDIETINKTLSNKLEAKNLVGGLSTEGYYPVPSSNLVIYDYGDTLDFLAFMHVIHDDTLQGEGNDQNTLKVNETWIDSRITSKTTSKLEANNLVAGENITLTTTDGNVTIASTAGGTSTITHDTTLTGEGTTTSPLSVVTTNFATTTALTTETTNRKNADSALESRISDNESNIEILQTQANSIQFDWLEFTGATTSTTYKRRFYSTAPCDNKLLTFQEQAGNPLGALYISAAGAPLVSSNVTSINLHTPGFMNAMSDPHEELSQTMLLHFMSSSAVKGYSWVIDPNPDVDSDEEGTTLTFTVNTTQSSTSVPVGTYFLTIQLRV